MTNEPSANHRNLAVLDSSANWSCEPHRHLAHAICPREVAASLADYRQANGAIPIQLNPHFGVGYCHWLLYPALGAWLSYGEFHCFRNLGAVGDYGVKPPSASGRPGLTNHSSRSLRRGLTQALAPYGN